MNRNRLEAGACQLLSQTIGAVLSAREDQYLTPVSLANELR